MSPYKYLDSLKESINKKLDGNEEFLEGKVFTNREYLTKLSEFVDSLRNIVEKSALSIYVIDTNSDVLELEGIKCSQVQIENMLLIQPLEELTVPVYSDLMSAVKTMEKKGALNNKMVLVLPHDINFLYARIKED